MAVGDTSDIQRRFIVARGWFRRGAPLQSVVFGGLADALAAVFALLMTVKAQTRFSGLSGWMIDLAAYDYFGLRFLRLKSESDASFLTRFAAEIFRERVTRAGIAKALQNLTGQTPTIIEFFNPGDCGGGYGVGHIAYGQAGLYGSLSFPNQVFVTAYQKAPPGIAYVGGYDAGGWGYGLGAGSYATLADSVGAVDDAAIYRAVADNVAAGVIAWTEIKTAA